MKLPNEFEIEMRSHLADGWDAFEASYQEQGFYGIRRNPLKILQEEFEEKIPWKKEVIPWCKDGYYYDGEQDQPAKHPYYYAGLYYIQEPSAMLPASLLPVEPGDKVLDLCAAPGGKSTQIAGKLKGQGLLVSNDISVSRTKALVKNLEMAGTKNAVVTSEKPEKLAKAFPQFFDKILVDAPCSGEGMFRRNAQMLKDYEKRGPKYYAPLQKEIVEQAIKMLSPGGYMVYSTCTFSPKENEELAAWVLEQWPEMEVVESFDFTGRDHGHPEWIGNADATIEHAYRMWPHKIHGEGHFAILFHRNGERTNTGVKPAKTNTKLKNAAEEFIKHTKFDDSYGYYMEIKDQIYLVPKEMPQVKGIRIVRSGLHMGQMKKDRFEPGQAFAMALKKEEYPLCVDFSVEDERVIKYLKCETIMADGPDGMVLILVDGYPLGWGKLSKGRLKNKYTAAWRWM